MARPLDGIAFQTYVRRLGFERATRELLIRIRSSPPNRTPGARHGNMPVWYPSKKMQCIIKAESAKVEFAFLLQAEHDKSILEFWDQPPAIPLEYRDRRNRVQRPFHTADYFVFGYQECGWVECKPAQELLKQAERRPHRYVLENGRWRCPPGEAFAASYGLTYRVWSSDEIRWAAQENWLYLEDYYQDLERLNVPAPTLGVLFRLVDESPGMALADLRAAAQDIPSDLINIAIANHALYVDLATYRLSEPWHTPVFRNRSVACASVQPKLECDTATVLPNKTAAAPTITFEGQDLLERARDVDLAAAIFRNRVINPDLYEDDEQRKMQAQALTIPARTKRYWRQLYREAERRYGSGLIGLLPRVANCGRKWDRDAEMSRLIQQVLETHYDTVTRKPKRGAYGQYLKVAEERQFKPVSQRTFYAEIERHKTTYDQILAREGKRAA